jgi:transcriptional regulator with XRE-family HTH domain
VSQLSIGGIGKRIARYRALNGWSAQQLASNTDGAISRDSIANIESGRRADMSLQQFLAIALALRVPPTALLVDLERPLDPSNIRFPGAAPAPLEPTAPHVAVASWLNAATGGDTTNAARWVSHVTALLTDYVATTDAAAMHDVLDRIAAPASRDEREQLAARHRILRKQLLAAGVHVPESHNEPECGRPVTGSAPVDS